MTNTSIDLYNLFRQRTTILTSLLKCSTNGLHVTSWPHTRSNRTISTMNKERRIERKVVNAVLSTAQSSLLRRMSSMSQIEFDERV